MRQADQDLAFAAQPLQPGGPGQRLAELQSPELVRVSGRQAVAGLDLDQPEDDHPQAVPGLQDRRGFEPGEDARRGLDVGRDRAEAGQEVFQRVLSVVELVIADGQEVEPQSLQDLHDRAAGRIVPVDHGIAREDVAGREEEDLRSGLPLGVEDRGHLGEGVDLGVSVVDVEDDDVRLGGGDGCGGPDGARRQAENGEEGDQERAEPRTGPAGAGHGRVSSGGQALMKSSSPPPSSPSSATSWPYAS